MRYKCTQDCERGRRIRMAMRANGYYKEMALAAEMEVSAAAVSKWIAGHTMSVENAHRLADLLQVSLDWLLRGTSSHTSKGLTAVERQLIDDLRARPSYIGPLVAGMVREIPPCGISATKAVLPLSTTLPN